jgi:hypothetical protein
MIVKGSYPLIDKRVQYILYHRRYHMNGAQVIPKQLLWRASKDFNGYPWTRLANRKSLHENNVHCLSFIRFYCFVQQMLSKTFIPKRIPKIYQVLTLR